MLFTQSGLTLYDRERATQGFTLFSPIQSSIAKIVDMEGQAVHQWELERGGINLCRLLDNGNLFITELTTEGPKIHAGKGGIMRE